MSSEEMLKEQGYEKAEDGTLIKFENDGDHIEGVLLGYEPSVQYPGSYVIKVRDEKGQNKAVFVSGIVIDKIKMNSYKVEEGKTNIMIIYKGKKDTADGKRQYNDYDVFFKN